MRLELLKIIKTALLVLFVGLTPVGVGAFHVTPPPSPPADSWVHIQSGIASFYAHAHHGRRTASGLIFNMYELTAAHPRLPFGTLVRVVNQKNGKSVLVKITDRGPFAKGRVIDLSLKAATVLGISGIAPVMLHIQDKETR